MDGLKIFSKRLNCKKESYMYPRFGMFRHKSRVNFLRWTLDLFKFFKRYFLFIFFLAVSYQTVFPEYDHIPFSIRLKLWVEEKTTERIKTRKLFLNRINNPFNIRFVKGDKWKGEVGEYNGFCRFSSMVYGIRAGLVLLNDAYFNKGYVTVAQIISKYAPVSENNTKQYIDYICKRMGVSSEEQLVPTKDVFSLLAMAITEKENGKKEGRTLQEIKDVLIKFRYHIRTIGSMD